MSYTIRVTIPGYDVLTHDQVSDFPIWADSNYVLIKEKARGSSTVSAGSTTNISHSLGYIPMVLVFAEAADGEVGTSGEWFHASGSDSNSLVGIEVTTSNLILINDASTHSKNFKYYIFYDQQV